MILYSLDGGFDVGSIDEEFELKLGYDIISGSLSDKFIAFIERDN